jgi:hypothetical protein
MDANFRMRMRPDKTKRSNDGPQLEPGWSAFVEEDAYQVKVKEYGDKKDVGRYLAWDHTRAH